MKSHLVNDHLRRAINVDVVRTHRNDIAPRSIRFGGFESFGDIYKRELNLSFEVCGDFTVFLPATLAGGSDCVAEDYGLREVVWKKEDGQWKVAADILLMRLFERCVLRKGFEKSSKISCLM